MLVRGCSLRYPKGECIFVKEKAKVRIEIRKMEVLFAEISHDGILGADFLGKIDLENIFGNLFGKSLAVCLKKHCFRIIEKEREVPVFLEELFKRDSFHLSEKRESSFADFLTEYQDVFAKEIVAGSCEIVEHRI